MSLKKVIATARGELGYTESPPGSNRTKYGAWIGLDGQPWCMSFLAWCFHQAGDFKAFMGGGKTGSCGILYRWYAAQGQTVPVEDVRAGDIVILNFSGTQDTQHCGLVEYTPVKGSMTIATIEGNTTNGSGSQSNGGEVCRKIRYKTQIVGVCRPKYKEEPMPQEKDYIGRWSEQDMRWADEAGLIKGYDDGTFRPAQTMTREEVIALLHRYDASKELGKL